MQILKRKLFWVAVLYAGLLIWSGIYRYNTPPSQVPKDRKTVQVNAVAGDKTLPRKIRLAYKEYLPKKETEGQMPVVLIHGSPGDADAFDSLAEMMPMRRLISVDLPGFGYSERNVPDYSIKAHAAYVYELLRKLNVPKAHLVGFSLGGGVVTYLGAEHPDNVASIAYVSSIGVQEYEMFGNYPVNHFVHGAQVALIWALKEFTPNFGIFDGMAMPYAWNFYDTDQRPLRKMMSGLKMPVLITHGVNDPLVPVEAAREHERIIPQSEYHEMIDNHFYVFMRPGMVEPSLLAFWKEVEAGKAVTRATASPERLKLAAEPFVPKFVSATGATAFVLFIALAILAFINEDVAFIVAGLFAAQGRFGPVFAMTACLFGILIAMFAFRRIGRRAGPLSRLISRAFPEGGAAWSRGFADLLLCGLREFGFVHRRYLDRGRRGTGFWKSLGLGLGSALMRAPTMIGLCGAAAVLLKTLTPIANTDTVVLTLCLFLLYLTAAAATRFFAPFPRSSVLTTED